MNIRGIAAAAAIMVFAIMQGEAADQVKGGKWEFSVQVQIPGLAQLPPGITLPPGVAMPAGVQIGSGGVSVVRAECINAANPVPVDPRGTGQGGGPCKLDKMEASGGTIKWAATCTSPDSVVRSEGVAHYNGDTMEADFTMRTTAKGSPPMEMSQHMTGRYLGPCDK